MILLMMRMKLAFGAVASRAFPFVALKNKQPFFLPVWMSKLIFIAHKNTELASLPRSIQRLVLKFRDVRVDDFADLLQDHAALDVRRGRVFSDHSRPELDLEL